MTAERRPRGRPRSAAAQAAILDAALDLFAERGLEGSSLEEIARRAGVARTTLYRRWPTKEAVLVDALARLREGGEPVVDWAAVEAADLEEIMLELAPDLLSRTRTARLFPRLLASALAHPQLIGAYVEGYLAPRRRDFAGAVERMKGAGQLPPHADPEVLQDMLSGAIVVKLLTTPEPPSRAEWRAYCARLLRSVGLHP